MRKKNPSNRFESIQKLLLKLLVFVLPTQLAIHFWPDQSLVNGIRVDYLSIAIYLSDLVILAFVGHFFLLKTNRQLLAGFVKRNIYIVFFSTLLVLLNTFISQEPLIAFVRWLKIGEWGLLIFVLINLKIDVEKEIQTPLAISVLGIVAIGLIQVYLGRTIGGALYLLGERTFNVYTPGISLINFWGNSFLRMYSIFPHPNALGAYLLVLVPLFFVWLKKEQKLLNYLGLIGCFVGIIFAFSVNVYLSFVLTLITYFWIRHCERSLNCITIFVTTIVVTSLLLMITANQLIDLKYLFTESISNRLMLSRVGGLVFSQSPFLGIGLNNFLYFIPKYSSLTGFVWLLQPVHNMFIYLLVETGLIGLLVVFWTLIKFAKHLVINNRGVFLFIYILILMTGFNDHYWITIQQNIFLLALVFSLASKPNENASF